MARAWTRDELIVAMNLYSRLTFGQLHARHPLIVAAAAKMDRSPSSLAMKLCNLASFDPAVTSRGRVGLKGASQLDGEVWRSFQADWETLGTDSEQRFNALMESAPVAEEEERWSLREGPTEMETTARRRLGQEFFRRSVLVSYNHRCCITGTPIPALLTASHIVAWSADRAQRLNPRNGLCLAKTQDDAFDRHLITLDEDLRVVLSKSIRDHFTSDNGGTPQSSQEPLRGSKGGYYEGGIREPFLAHWPAVIKPGSRSDVPVINVDLFPTFLAAAGAPVPAGKVLDGESLLPLFRGTGSLARQSIFWHFPGYLNQPVLRGRDLDVRTGFRSRPVSVIRQGDWKLHLFHEEWQLDGGRDRLATNGAVGAAQEGHVMNRDRSGSPNGCKREQCPAPVRSSINFAYSAARRRHASNAPYFDS